MPKGKQPNKRKVEDVLVEGFSVNGKLLSSIDALVQVLRKVHSFEVAIEKRSVSVAYVESRDINKRPYQFAIYRIYDNHIEVIYTIPPTDHPMKRRVEVIKLLANISILLHGHYTIGENALLELMEDAVSEMLLSLDKNYSEMYTEYDHVLRKYEDLMRKYRRLEDEREALLLQNFELRSKNEKLSLELGRYKKLSDDMLKVKILEWIKDHGGTIDIYEFSTTYNIPEARIKDAINELLNENYIKLIT